MSYAVGDSGAGELHSLIDSGDPGGGRPFTETGPVR